jgi:molybdate transport system substrate-binding protein
VSRAVRRVLAAVAACASAACAAGSRDANGPLTVFAAADLRRALPEVARAYRAAGGDSVVMVFGATRALAAQIEHGAPADAFLAADDAVAAELAARGVVVDSTRTPYAVGRLVVVAACAVDGAGSAGVCPRFALADLAVPAVRSVSLANPEHAPYGRAARQALERAGLWQAVEPKLVVAADVAQAFQLVVTGNVDAGLVAVAVVHDSSGVASTLVPDTLHDRLRQTAAVVAASANGARALAFVRYVAGADGQAVLRRHGFEPPGAAPERPLARVPERR